MKLDLKNKFAITHRLNKGLYEDGIQFIYPQLLDDWKKTVKRLVKLNSVEVLTDALYLMENLAEGKGLDEVKKLSNELFTQEKENSDDLEYTEKKQAATLRVVENFSKRGPEFSRVISNETMTEEKLALLEELQTRNNDFAKQIVKSR